jgi:hypothetical protein
VTLSNAEHEIAEIIDQITHIWCDLHDDREVGSLQGHYPCKLCGATMYECMDYTHKPDCPVVLAEAAINAFGEAIAASQMKDVSE